MRHFSFRHPVIHRQTDENLRGNTFHSQGRVVLEAKTPIERRITDQNAAVRPGLFSRHGSGGTCQATSLRLEETLHGSARHW